MGVMSSGIDWQSWMVGLGRNVRRARELSGLTQQQLAERAGVSQGAVSRLETGRGLATPLLVVLGVAIALQRELRQIAPELLSDEMRALLRLDAGLDGEASAGFRDIAFLADEGLSELIRRYRALAEPERRRLVRVVTATADALDGHSSATVGSEPSREREVG
jgi:transcriptional regulator with XRE-family HTH domain